MRESFSEHLSRNENKEADIFKVFSQSILSKTIFNSHFLLKVSSVKHLKYLVYMTLKMNLKGILL